MPARARNGFTLIELLVVIAIIAVLIGLLVPAVQKIREVAARMQSANNMKQIGLASHSMHDAQGRLPPQYGYYSGTGTMTATPAQYGSYFYHLLPFIEQNSVYLATVNRSYTNTTVIKTFQAPLDPSLTGDGKAANSQGVSAGLCSYVLNGYVLTGNSNALSYYLTGTSTNGNTADGLTRNGRMSEITDGTSNTVLVAERYSYDCLYSGSGASAVKGNRTWGEDASGPSRWAPVLIHSDPIEFTPVSGFSSCYVPQAFRGSGCQIGMFDGSVRNVTKSVSSTTWWRVLLQNDGQTISSDW